MTEKAGQQEIVMYSTIWCRHCITSRQIFDEIGVPFREINIEENEEATALVLEINRGMMSVPTIVFPNGEIMVEPPPLSLRQALTKFRSFKETGEDKQDKLDIERAINEGMGNTTAGTT